MAYMAWLVAHGVREYPALLSDEGFLSAVMAKESRDGVTGLQHLVWTARPDVQRAFPLPAKRNEFNQWYYTRGVKEMGLWATHLGPELGENLVAFLDGFEREGSA